MSQELLDPPSITDRSQLVRDRAHMLDVVRSFFKERNVLEVDCCALVRCASLDANVEVMSLHVTEEQRGFLHTSPEYAMKRLLADGVGDIFYLGHVFRKGEIGRLHNPEFTMIEFYRTNANYPTFIDEACALIMMVIGEKPLIHLTYRDAFKKYVGIDPFNNVDLPAAARRHNIQVPPDALQWDRDTWLNLLMSHLIEPQLGHDSITIIYGYPPSQAALSRIVIQGGVLVAERFEIYSEGVELANGYHELADAQEQRRRFLEENRARVRQGKEEYALDEQLLSALDRGFPDACGVSIGFDRLMLIRHKAPNLQGVLPFAWSQL